MISARPRCSLNTAKTKPVPALATQASTLRVFRRAGLCLTAVTLGSDVTFWAGGVVQNIEAAAMDLYVIYRHAEGSYLAPATGAKTNIDDFDMLISGARIQF